MYQPAMVTEQLAQLYLEFEDKAVQPRSLLDEASETSSISR